MGKCWVWGYGDMQDMPDMWDMRVETGHALSVRACMIIRASMIIQACVMIPHNASWRHHPDWPCFKYYPLIFSIIFYKNCLLSILRDCCECIAKFVQAIPGLGLCFRKTGVAIRIQNPAGWHVWLLQIYSCRL